MVLYAAGVPCVNEEVDGLECNSAEATILFAAVDGPKRKLGRKGYLILPCRPCVE